MRALLILALAAACRPVVPAAPFMLRVAVSGPLEPVVPKPDMQSWTSIALPIVFEPLVTIGQRGEIVPVLASRVEVAGPRALRLWLRPGVRFSDGAAVTFADVAGSLAPSRLQVAQDGASIVVTSEEAGIPPELVLSRAYVFRRGRGRALGTGAFDVQEQDASHVVLARVRPEPNRIGRVRLDAYPTPQDAFAHTLRGDADMLPEVLPRWVEFFEGVPRLRMLRAPAPTANMVAFNLKRLDRAERLALAGILSGDDLRRTAFGDDCVPPANRPGIEPLRSGRPLDVLAVPFLSRFAFAVRRALGPRGGEVRTAELQSFLSVLKSGEFDLAIIRPRVWPPIFSVLNWRTGASSNLLGYSNPAVDAALDARDWAAAQRALEKDPPGAIVCTPQALVVLDSRIQNASLSTAFMESLPQWEVKE